ncbi:MAG: hypothetical protein WKG00_12490 [Polyangiaceae bacterium]
MIEGRTSPLADGSVVTFLSPRLAAGQPVENALRAILARTGDATLADQIHRLLGETS